MGGDRSARKIIPSLGRRRGQLWLDFLAASYADCNMSPVRCSILRQKPFDRLLILPPPPPPSPGSPELTGTQLNSSTPGRIR